jgi:hypothetical protein
MGDASLEVIHEAVDGAGVLVAIVTSDAGSELTCDRPARCLISCLRAGLELRHLAAWQRDCACDQQDGAAGLPAGSTRAPHPRSPAADR